MEENRSTHKIYDDKIGEVQIADSVVAIVAGLAAMEVEGVSSMSGNITSEIISKLGLKKLSKGVTVAVSNNDVEVNLSLNLLYGYNVMDISSKVQEKVKTAIENMTGLTVTVVNIKITSVNVQ